MNSSLSDLVDRATKGNALAEIRNALKPEARDQWDKEIQARYTEVSRSYDAKIGYFGVTSEGEKVLRAMLETFFITGVTSGIAFERSTTPK